MKKINFDSGVRTYKLGEGVLRFNPGDPNLYARFMEGADKLRAVEKSVAEQEEDTDVLSLLHKADKEMKAVLDWIFGPGNDFEEMLMGVNLLAVAANGERVVTNLFAALEPILVAGAEACAKAAAESAKARRASR